MDDQQPDEPKRTPEQEAAIQRHLRHQARTRKRKGQHAPSILKQVATGTAKGCGGVTLILLVVALILLAVAANFWLPMIFDFLATLIGG